ncbi:3-oxoacyl-[acyl-carrier-protein] synthase III [Hydrocarboniphaga daqingensis]|uniref:Beta-ketoacyl-[acyl-carrier-protein] synthase III n=1 Tax=Hydrocarboniphaga daqingensis TaxID=490188 RepID=A0A1M5S776_9GAMM|nr:beta-ketoacyl-ACP synthase III [Hydrocarboniphaga daqingensis]SHH33783.1 3-oxoacyl-[acyl-carrier-protein] synthase III [Hydrocarboniphaga daqingensis]
MAYSRIAGTGSYLPEQRLTNQQLAKTVDTTDEWIFERTGIRARHIAAAEQQTSDLALHAAQRAMEAAGVTAADIDLIVVATSTPDMIFPSTACLLQAKLGVTRGAAFDVQAVCSGFIYALATADKFVSTGSARCALVIGAETFSRILDWTDRRTCVLFGDGAGAVVLTASDQPGVLSSHLHSDGRHSGILRVPGGVQNGKVVGNPFVEMNGQAVYKQAVRVLGEVTQEALSAHGLTGADLDWMVPHQANIRIIMSTAEKLGLKPEQVVTTVHEHGNTSAASIPLALDTAVRDGRIQRGHNVIFEAVGGGLTWGAVLVRW